VLVPLYWELNLEEVHGVLESELETVREFGRVVKKIASAGSS